MFRSVEAAAVAGSCPGESDDDRPLGVLLTGLGDGLDKPAGFPKTLSETERVCSYDRLAETLESSGKILTAVPASATGQAAEPRGQSMAVYIGLNPENLTVQDGEVGSLGDVPVEVIQHGPYPAAIPQYGDALEEASAEGQRRWLRLSSHSKPVTTPNSGHNIYVDQPWVAVEAAQRVTAEAAE